VVGFQQKADRHRLDGLNALINDFQQEGLFATAAMMEDEDFARGMRSCISIKASAFFKPNTIFTSVENHSEAELQALVDMARVNGMGVAFLAVHHETVWGRERSVNLWVRDQSPDWQLGLRLANLDYAVLMSYQLKVNWKARIRALSAVGKKEHVDLTRAFLTKLLQYARINRGVEILAEQRGFLDFVSEAPRADLNIFGLSELVNKAFMEDLTIRARSSCLFLLDSGQESALA